MPNLTTALVEERMSDLKTVADGIYADLGGVFDPDEDDPAEMPDEPSRHFALSLSRAYQALAELRRAGLAIDPNWTPPNITPA